MKDPVTQLADDATTPLALLARVREEREAADRAEAAILDFRGGVGARPPGAAG